MGGVCPWEVFAQGGVCLGGYLPGGSAQGVSATHPHPVHAGIQTPSPVQAGTPRLWTEFLTHTCENGTSLQLLLRTVKSGTRAQGLLLAFQLLYPLHHRVNCACGEL